MSKYDRESRDVYAVKRLGDEIGYGHLMALAHELWAKYLEEKGLPRKGAHCAVGYPMIKDEYQADAITDPIYKVIVERALADTPQTERCYKEEDVVRVVENVKRGYGLTKTAEEIVADMQAETQNSNLTFEKQTDCEITECDYHKYCKARGQTDCGWKRGRYGHR